MKTLPLASSLGLAASLLVGCSDPNQDVLEKAPGAPATKQATEQVCTTFLLGDKDGFGQGFKEGHALYLPAGTSLPLNWQNNDPFFTDVYPADIAPNGNSTHQIQFSMEYTPPSQIGSARILLNTLGIQDGDAQVCGSDTDIKLFIDGQEIPQAFDAIDQFDNMDGRWSDIAGHLEITVPGNLLYLLKDGKVDFRWEILQKIPGMQSYDAFAIDYIELSLCTGDDR
ncbi:MAG: hypothetical protein JNN04_05230 [Cyclobacteriaceae bacterium]|nr:hypothetical protein [Cyclobacteriaceae bacterium]